MVQVFTSRPAYAGDDKVNIAVHTGQTPGLILAPTQSLDGGYKRFVAEQTKNATAMRKWSEFEPLSWEAYRERYLELLRARYAANKQPFVDLLSRERLVLTCYCAPFSPCHRTIVVEVLAKIAQHQGLAFEYGGELDPHTGLVLLPPTDPRRQGLTFHVVRIMPPHGKTSLGYAVLARHRRDAASFILEIAHIGPSHPDIGEAYSTEVIRQLTEQSLPLEGRANDLEATLDFVRGLAIQNGLSPTWQELSQVEDEQLERDSYLLVLPAANVKPLSKLGLDLDSW